MAVSWFTTPPREEPSSDEPDCPSYEEVKASLQDMHLANRLFGGRTAVLKHLLPLIAASESQDGIKILDVGTGYADVIRHLVLWSRARNIELQVVGVERNPMTASMARQCCSGFPEIIIVEKDAFSLDYPPQAFDFVISSMLLHYFSNPEVQELLEILRKLSRRTVIVTDLVRHWFPLLAIRLLSSLCRSRLFRPASARSVRRGFTCRELLELASNAGFEEVKVFTHFPFRFCLIGSNRTKAGYAADC